MSTYPSINSIDFYQKINTKYNKYKIPNTKRSLKQICFPNKYELQIPQQFLAEIINPDTPYLGLLVYHRIGAGKTCTAIMIGERFKYNFQIIVVLPASLIGNFRSELRSQCADDLYLTSKERSMLKSLHPSSTEYKDIIDKSNARIDKVYTIYSYNKFVDLIKHNQINFNNTLLVIDEIHNMISETGTYYESIYKTLHVAPPTLRTVIMSATPIFDKPIEIALTMNLLIRKNAIPTGQKFISTFMDITYTTNGPIYNVKNMDLLKKYVKGYVSYYRGAPPHVFPRSIIKTVRIKMSETQQKIYRQIISKESKTTKLEDYVNVDISNSFFIGTRMVSNIVFPNGKIGLDGFKSLTDSDFDRDRIKELSPKFCRIFSKIKKCKGTVFVYSSFKEYGGIKTFAKLLEHYRYRDYEESGPGKKRFAIWSGDQLPQTKEEIKSVFNNINNVDGSKIKVILGSPSIKEGVSLLRVQEVHVMEPYWNMSRMDQIIGRAIRFCSHKDVPLENQLVKVYIYQAIHPKIKVSVDEHIMKIAIVKQNINSKFELALKEAAIDCELFKNANEDDIVCQV